MISGAAVNKDNDTIKAVLHANRSMAHINMVELKFLLTVYEEIYLSSQVAHEHPANA